jgi:hypothetical protein
MEFFLYDEGQAFLKNLILILEHISFFFEMHAFFFSHDIQWVSSGYQRKHQEHFRKIN